SVIEEIDLPVSNNLVTLNEGCYQMNLNFRLSPAVNEYAIIIAIQVNGVNEVAISLHKSMDAEGTLSHMIKAKSGDKLSVVAGKSSSGTGTLSFWDSIYNKITIKKIGGV